jgi:VWFA-related protein
MRLLPLLVTGSLCGLVASPPRAQEIRPPDSGLTIKSNVNEVMLDLVVRDKHGKLVKNLKPGDLEIYEDGARQDIRSFRLIAGPETPPPPEPPAASAKPETAPSPAQRTVSATSALHSLNLICIVFQNLDLNTKKYAVEAVEEFLKEDLPANTWVAIFNLNQNLTVLHNFTANREELLEAAHNAKTGTTLDFISVTSAIMSAQPNVVTVTVSGSPGPNSNTGSATVDFKGGDLNPYAIYGADVDSGPGAALQRGEMVQQRRVYGHIEGMRETDQIIMLVEQLGKLPGRKTVLLLTPGLQTTGDPDRFGKILSRANKADVTVYSIDVNGLTQNSNQQASTAATRRVAYLSKAQRSNASGGVDSNMELMRQDDYLHEAVRTSDPQASLRALSEGTGGFLIANTNDLRKPFRNLLADMDTHYEAVYSPASDRYDGHFRKITFKLARADLNVESRAGYYAMPALGRGPLAAFEINGLIALNANPAPHAFDFHSAAYQFRPEGVRPEGATAQCGVAFETSAASLTATAEPEQKKHRVHVSILALVKDSSGQIVDKFSEDSVWEVADENLAALKTQSVTWTHPFNLPPGHYTVETAILDREGNRAATGRLALNNPPREGLALSNAVMVQRVEAVSGTSDAADPFQFSAKRVIPELASDGAATPPAIYFVVYPDKVNTEKPKLQVEFFVNGQVVAKQVSDLPAADASGAIPMMVSAVRRPGDCELRIAALQGSETAEQSVAYKVAAR